MKAKTKSKQTAPSPEFTPFEFPVRLRTIQEARLLYHVLNTIDIKENLDVTWDNYSRGWNYSADFAEDFEDNNLHDLRDIITKQGFTI